ncbi:MAG: hypothetical protein Kow0031_06170 [Anaerolineae bacterium]
MLAFGLPFLLYVLTLAPTVYNLDSAELTTAAATGGIVRATGYPLYLMLGHLWSWLPLGDVGYRLNLFSAFNGALTIALAERILRRRQIGPWATFGALGLLACAPFFWALSLIAEVYTLHTALMAAIILLLLRWAEQPTPLRLAEVSLVVGLSSGHHAATVLLIPGCVWYVLTTAPRKALSPRSLLFAMAAFLLGLSVYLYLPWRYSTQPAFNYAGRFDATGTFSPIDLQTLAGLWWLVSGRVFAGEMLAYQGFELWAQTAHFGVQLWQAFFAIGLGPGLIGLALLIHRDWRLGGMLLLMFSFSAGFYIDYRVVDKDTMFLPAYLVWALWVGVGYQEVLDWIGQAREQEPWLTRLEGGLLRLVIAGSVLLVAAWNWPLANQSDDWSTRQRGETILRQVEPNALIFDWWDTVPVIEYLQLVEGQRPDVQAINRFLIEPRDMRQLIRREITNRPIYIDQPPADLRHLVEAEPVGPLYRLQLRSRPIPMTFIQERR